MTARYAPPRLLAPDDELDDYFQAWTNVGYRVWIGGQLVMDQWAEPDVSSTGWTAVGGAGTGSYSKPPVAYALTAAATDPIRVELKDETGRASFALRRQDPVTGWAEVPASDLAPRLGLATSGVDADGHVTRTDYTGGSVSAVYGLPISTTTETTPADLVETFEYESDFLRPTSRTLPARSWHRASRRRFLTGQCGRAIIPAR